jgi:hypothetical protein
MGLFGLASLWALTFAFEYQPFMDRQKLMMGLHAQDLLALSNEDLDEYLGEVMGHYGLPRDESMENLAAVAEGVDHPARDGLEKPELPIRNRNAEPEAFILNMRPRITAAPEITSAPKRQVKKVEKRRGMSILKVDYLKSQKHIHREPSDYDDFYHHHHRGSYDDDDYYYSHHHGYHGYSYDYDMAFEDMESYPEELTFNDNLTKQLEWLRPVYQIKDIRPKSVHHFLTKPISLEITPNISSNLFCFCKFDGVIIRGSVNSSGLAICKPPPHAPGMIPVFFSVNNETWFGPFEFLYESSGGLESLLLLAPTAVVFIGICAIVIYIISLLTKKGMEPRNRVPPRRRFKSRSAKA